MMRQVFSRHPRFRIVMTLLVWAAFGVAFLESIRAVVTWWQGGSLADMDAVWLALFPVCLFVYLRYVSIFRRGCGACGLETPQDDRRGPRA